ncbi:MAG: hypothetical protein ABW252_17370 [Polyangiales bacterium]
MLGRRTFHALLGVVCVALAWLACAAAARADDPARAALKPRDYWSSEPIRPFLGAVIDAGSSVRARMLAGYGRPHWTWAGLELEAATTTDVALAAVRARVALVVADVGLAYRVSRSYRHTWVAREQGYSDGDLEGRPRARYRSLDLDVWGVVPIPHSLLQWEVEAVRLYGVPRGVDVYEEWLRAPVRPPWSLATRLAYAYTFLNERASAGLMLEWLWLGQRAGGGLTRIGPLLGYAFTPHWEVNVLLTTPVHSPDDLTLFTGLYGTARVRWRFATGERTKVFR